MFKRKIDKTTNEVLYKENKKLLRENTQLKKELDVIAKYKKDYEELSEQLKECKKKYEKRFVEIDKLEKEYKKELEKLVNK